MKKPTVNQIEEALKVLSPNQIQTAVNGPGDYLGLSLKDKATVKSYTYFETREQERNNSKELFLHKDIFADICYELEHEAIRPKHEQTAKN